MLVSGAVAQLGERLVCNQEATGSIPVSSTNFAYAEAHGLAVMAASPGYSPACGADFLVALAMATKNSKRLALVCRAGDLCGRVPAGHAF